MLIFFFIHNLSVIKIKKEVFIMKKKKKVEDIFKYRDMSPQKKKAVSLGGIIVIGITTVAIGLRMKGGLCK